VAFDSFGNLFISYLAAPDVLSVTVLQSTDGGVTFPTSYRFQDSAKLDRPTIKTGPSSGWIIFRDDNMKDVVASGAAVTGLNTPKPLSWSPLTRLHPRANR